MSRFWPVCMLLAMVLSAQAQSLTTIVTNGPASRRINIVVLAEGYTSNQVSLFQTHATTTVNNLLTVSPYTDYRSYFNAFAIFVPSRQAGSDHPSRGEFRDTYFNSTFDSYGIDRLVTIPPNNFDSNYSNGRGKVDQLLQQLMPEYDLAILLVNDLEYGGSGGEVLITSRSSLSAEIVRHESGHTFAGLDDEYSDPNPGYPDIEGPNTTRERRREFIKWRHWIEPGTPVPTPATAEFRSVVGLFEGAHYQVTDWFRPKLDCRMRSYGAPFCEVCTETLVKATYQRIRPIELFAPVQTNLSVFAGQPVRFDVQPLRPPLHSLQVRWLTNGIEAAGVTSEQFTFATGGLNPGIHTVEVQVRDQTAFVRSDPEKLLDQSLAWRVDVAPAPLLRLEVEPIVANVLELRISGQGDLQFVLERATVLPVWSPVSTNQLSGGSFRYTEALPPQSGGAYYRTVIYPSASP
jgi:hypothetical protein